MMLSKFVGIPYDLHNRTGINCWALVALVYDEIFGDKLKDYSAKNFREVSTAFTSAFFEGDHGFNKVDSPEDFDVVVLWSKRTVHCGIYYEGNLLHANNDAKQVIFEKLKNASRSFERIEFWRK